MKFTASSVIALVLAVPGLQACSNTESAEARCYSSEINERPQNIDRNELKLMIDNTRNSGNDFVQNNCAEWTIQRQWRTQALTRKTSQSDAFIRKDDILQGLKWIYDNCEDKGGAHPLGNDAFLKVTKT